MAGRLIASGLAALAFASPAAAQSTVLDEAAEGLRADPVYVPRNRRTDRGRGGPASGCDRREGAAPSRSRSSQSCARSGLQQKWPLSSHSSWRARRLRSRRREPVPRGQQRSRARPGSALATRAFQTRSQDGVAAVLLDFVQRVGDLGAASPASEGGGASPPGCSWPGGRRGLLGVRAIGGDSDESASSGKSRRSRAKTSSRSPTTSSGSTRRSRHIPTRRRPLAAMEAYQRADDAFDRARSPEDLAASPRHRRLALRDGDGEGAHERSTGAGAAAAVLLRRRATAPRSRT